MQSKLLRRGIAVLSMSVLAVIATISMFSSPEAEALPSNDVTHVYFHDAAHTQYAGEEWIMSCNGAVGMMVDGVRTKYHVNISESCSDQRQTYKCYKCDHIRGYPTYPVCNSPAPAGIRRLCPPNGF